MIATADSPEMVNDRPCVSAPRPGGTGTGHVSRVRKPASEHRPCFEGLGRSVEWDGTILAEPSICPSARELRGDVVRRPANSAPDRRAGAMTMPLNAPEGWSLGGGQPPAVIGFYLVPGFPLLSFSAAIDPLRQANRLTGRTLYRWVLISTDGAPVRSSAGVDVAVDGSIDTTPPCHLVIICAGLDTPRHYSGRMFTWLRRLRRQGCRLGAMSTGAYLIARAGLLDGRRCTVHWENTAEFQDAFPRCNLTRAIFSIDGPFITSSGGTVTLDMMLYLVEAAHGRPLAAAISEQLNHSRIRLTDEAQRMRPQAKFGITHAKLCEAIGLMEDNIETPVELAVIAGCIDLSRRQIERLFHTHLKETPSSFYARLRLERAHTLVSQSTLSLAEIARSCGYETLAHFGRMYRRRFGATPAQARRGRGP